MLRSLDVALWATVSAACSLLPGQSCNHTGRVVAVEAGDRNFTTVHCGAFSISVAGVTIPGPAQCIRGGANYAGTVYTCQGHVQDSNCTQRGFKVVITTYTDGACPNLVGLIPGANFAEWKKVPAAVRRALECVPPKKARTFDWSASVTDCPRGSRPSRVGQVHQGANGSSYAIAEGAAYTSYGTANPFLTGYDLAQGNHPSVVQGTLGTLIVPLHPRIAGAFVTATLEVTHEEVDPADHAARTVSILGSMLANGRFDLAMTSAVDAEGKPVALRQQLSFDGNALSAVWDGAENGNRWDASAAHQAHVIREITDAAPLFGWVRDPFEIPWFEGVTYEEQTVGTRIYVRRRLDETIGNGIDMEYELDTSGEVTHPVTTRIFDAEGEVVEETTYEDYRTLAPGVWRPFLVTRTRYLQPGAQKPRIVVRLKIAEAAILKASDLETVPAPSPDDQVWFHWL
jgi:hypothetical protein